MVGRVLMLHQQQPCSEEKEEAEGSTEAARSLGVGEGSKNRGLRGALHGVVEGKRALKWLKNHSSLEGL